MKNSSTFVSHRVHLKLSKIDYVSSPSSTFYSIYKCRNANAMKSISYFFTNRTRVTIDESVPLMRRSHDGLILQLILRVSKSDEIALGYVVSTIDSKQAFPTRVSQEYQAVFHRSFAILSLRGTLDAAPTCQPDHVK